jgi:hypothetical protein
MSTVPACLEKLSAILWMAGALVYIANKIKQRNNHDPSKGFNNPFQEFFEYEMP